MSAHPSKHGAGSPPSSAQKAPPSKQQAAKRSKELRADFLLNFQRPAPSPHQRPSAYAPPPRRSGRPSGKQGRAPAAFVRGRFVQSSFRIFVDGPSNDVLEASFSSDALIDWPNVRCVDLLCDEHPKCPICLEQSLVVPKITRCGHIFCLPCIMRYFLMLQGQNLMHVQRCPVCNEQVSPEDLTSVRFQMTRALREDQRLSFVLAHREASSISVRGSASAAMAVSPPSDAGNVDESSAGEAFRKLPSESDPGWHFSRVVRLMPGEHGCNLAREAKALRLYRPVAIKAGDTELLPSIDAAIDLLGHQFPKGALAALAEQPAAESPALPWGCRYVEVATGAIAGSSSSGAAAGEAVEYDGAAAGPDDGDELDGLEPQSPCASASASPAHGVHSSPALAAASPTSDTAVAAASSPSLAPLPEPRISAVARGGARIISFYQAEDGRLVFLQPFFTKLLLHEHGGRWDRLPAALAELKLERLHELTITEEVRKRYRFLAHLPLGSPAWFAEVDLRDHLSKETKELFADEFAKRRQWMLKEKAKSRREDRQSKQRSEIEEDQYWRSGNRSHDYVIEPPPTKQDFAVDLQGRTIIEPEAPDANGERGDEDAADGVGEDAAPTLAEKLKGKLKPKVGAKVKPKAAGFSGGESLFPSLGAGSSGAARGTNPSKPAWGAGNSSSSANNAGASSSADQPEVVVDSWEDRQPDEDLGQDEPTLGQALEAALRKSASKAPAATEEVPEAGAQAAAGKKKKGKAAKGTTLRLFG